MARSFPIYALLAALVFSASPGLCQQEEDAEARRIGIIFEGTFESADIAKVPPSAKKTQYVASYEWDYGVRSFTEELWNERGFDWERFMPIALRLADSIAEKIEPQLVRDHREVIEYALFSNDDPFLSSIVLSPIFYEKLKGTLGDELRVIIVDRYRIYVFPATGGKLEEYGEALVGDFINTKLPVSLEVFRLDANGLEVIGELERQ